MLMENHGLEILIIKKRFTINWNNNRSLLSIGNKNIDIRERKG